MQPPPLEVFHLVDVAEVLGQGGERLGHFEILTFQVPLNLRSRFTPPSADNEKFRTDSCCLFGN